MKIAVTYNNGDVFQHFGRTETFKIYVVEDRKIVTSEIIGSEGAGHGALAGVLAENGVDILICGGLGDGAMNALTEAGISVVSGVSGNADDAVQALLNDELESTGVNCDHHHEEAEAEGCGGGCGSDCGSCGSGCGGCGGGCGSSAPAFEGKNVGHHVKVHYQGTFDNGEQFDSSYDRGETLDFICGAGMMIKGFDKAVATMEVGEVVNIHLMPDEAYGYPDPNAIFTVNVNDVPGAAELEVGQRVYLKNIYGEPFPVCVTEREGDMITFDANNEMAGKELNFKIELVEVVD